MKIDEFDKESVTLKWKEPDEDGGNPIKGNLTVVSPAVAMVTKYTITVIYIYTPPLFATGIKLRRQN